MVTKKNIDYLNGILCRPKEQGGLVIMDLNVQNKCLLSKWLFKLTNEDGIWQQILRNKYLKSKILTQVEKKPGDSQFWSGLMSVKQDFLKWMTFKVHNGNTNQILGRQVAGKLGP